jgi:hypothetical protein
MSNGDAAVLGASCLVLEDAGQLVGEEVADRFVSDL